MAASQVASRRWLMALLGFQLACSQPAASDAVGMTGGAGNSSSAGTTSAGGNGGAAPQPTAGNGGHAGSYAGSYAGSTGGGGSTSGTGGASMLSLKLPIERDDKLVLEFGETYFEVKPSHGARITSLRQGGQELLTLTGAPNFEDAFGSTFWPSPQTWEWPPPAEFDLMDYAATVEARGSITLMGQVHQATGLKIEKRFTADLVREALVLEYSLINSGSEPTQWAPWEVTRVPAQGLAFWPTGSSSFGETPLVCQMALGHTWCEAAATQGEAKLFADAGGGYVAYAIGGTLLIKQFVDLPQVNMAPGEAEIELYVNEEHSYVEVENQGAYSEIAPGGALRWQVTWYARRLPDGMTASIGNADLIAFVEKTLQ